MPTKLNKAGNQQNYVPKGNGDASGEYGDNADGSNIHFKSFKKPEGETKTEESGFEEINNKRMGTSKPKKEEKPLGVEVKDTSTEPADTSKIKNKYDGTGKDLLKDTLSKRLPKGKNTSILLEAVKDADDEYSGVCADFYANNPQVELKLGKNLNSKYQTITEYNYYTGERKTSYKVSLGTGVFDREEYYSKGGVFFHETGHGIDATYIDETGHKSVWSYYYVSKKHNATISQEIATEIQNAFGEDMFKEDSAFKKLKEDIKLEQEQLKKEFFTEAEEAELEELKKLRTKQINIADNDPTYLELKSQQEKALELVNESREKWYSDLSNSQYSQEFSQNKQNFLEIAKKSQEAWKKALVVDEVNEARFNELNDKKYSVSSKAQAKICVKYGDLSDMIMGTTGQDLCGMGHASGYWDNKSRGEEAFAEIMSAKATNKESYEILKKYIPKTIEIFDEIMDNIRGNKK